MRYDLEQLEDLLFHVPQMDNVYLEHKAKKMKAEMSKHGDGLKAKKLPPSKKAPPKRK